MQQHLRFIKCIVFVQSDVFFIILKNYNNCTSSIHVIAEIFDNFQWKISWKIIIDV